MRSLSWPRALGMFLSAGKMFQLSSIKASSVIKQTESGFKKVGIRRKTSISLLNYFAGCESGSNGVDFDLHVVARFGLWDKDD